MRITTGCKIGELPLLTPHLFYNPLGSDLEVPEDNTGLAVLWQLQLALKLLF